jgi:hypothetical protein
LKSLAIALALSLPAATSWADGRIFVHRVALVFEPGSSALPAGGAAVLQSIVDDTGRECGGTTFASIAVEEVVALPLGKTTAGATQRTRQVAAVLRDLSSAALQPVEGSVAAQAARALRLGLKPDQVVVELTCPVAR